MGTSHATELAGGRGVWSTVARISWIGSALLVPTMVPAFVIGGLALRVADAGYGVALLVGWLLRRRLGLWANAIITVVATAGALLQLDVPARAVTTAIPPGMVHATLLVFALVGSYAGSFLAGWWGLGAIAILIAALVATDPLHFVAAGLALAVAGLLGVAVHLVICRLEEHHSSLVSAAFVDPLTGLGNRRALELAFERAQQRARDEDRSLFVSVWDLDGLKATNDAHGHQAGDRLLDEFARTLVATLHAGDLVFRIGGDEFCCLHFGLKDGASIVERMELAFPSVSGGFAAVGVAQSLQSVIAEADAAMYANKRRRRTS